MPDPSPVKDRGHQSVLPQGRDLLVFSPYLYGKSIIWKVMWTNQKWGRGRGRGSGIQVGV